MPGAKEVDPNEGWKEIGKAKYAEQLMPCLFKDVESQTLEVPVQESEETPGLYRLVDPYKYWTPFQADAFTVADKGYYMVIHTENAPDVWFENTNAGVTFNGQGGGMIGFYCQLGDIMTSMSYEEVKTQLPAELWAKIDNGVITFPSLSFNFNGNNFTNYGATLSSQPDGFYPAKTNMMKIELPTSGVENIEAVEEGEAEYFTLQGVRVANPESGMLVIKRAGGKTSKMIVR